MRPKRRQTLLEYLAEGRSYDEIAEVIGVSYHTAWRMIKELIDEGMVEELSTRDNEGRLRFIQTGRRDKRVLLIQWKQGTVEPLGDIIFKFHQPYMEQTIDNTVLTKPYELLAYLYRRSLVLRSLDGSWDASPAAAAGGVVSTTSVQMKLRAARKQLLTQASIIEQVLLRHELFDDSSEVSNLFGIESEKVAGYVSELGAKFVARGKEG